MARKYDDLSSLQLSRNIESVPLGTDSSFNNGDGRGWLAHLEGREYLPRDEFGLIDLRLAYEQYLTDDPETIPVQITDEMKDEWWHQHLYFWRLFFLQKDVHPDVRDQILTAFRQSIYNQIVMRPEQERAVHKRFARMVSPPDPEAMSSQLTDFAHLDRLGASAVGKRIALAPEALEYLAPGNGYSKAWRRHSIAETTRFFDREIEKMIEILSEPLVTDQRVITGAIRRMGLMINSDKLLEEAESRKKEDAIYYPIRIPKLQSLYSLSVTMLEDINLIPLPATSQGVQDLQKEAKVIELFG